MAIVRSVGPGRTGPAVSPVSSSPAGVQLVRAGLPAGMSTQRLATPTQTIIVTRPPNGGTNMAMNVVTTAMRHPSGAPILVNHAASASPSGIRVQAPPNMAAARAAGQMPAAQNVVINHPGVRPGQPGSQITVPFQTLQNLRPGHGIPTGQAGHLLVKTETGQYQIVRVNSTIAAATPMSVATASPAGLATHPLPVTSVMSVRPTQALVSAASPRLVTSVSSISTCSTMAASTSRPATVAAVSSSNASAAAAAAAAAAASGAGGAGGGGGGGAGGAGGMGAQMTPDAAKLKCKNFLATLLRLAGEQPPMVAANVRNLIQGLIDGKVEPEVFTTKLQKELNSSPQPCLVPFLKKSLPYLQQSLISGELCIDGVRPPQLRLPPQPLTSSSAAAAAVASSSAALAAAAAAAGLKMAGANSVTTAPGQRLVMTAPGLNAARLAGQPVIRTAAGAMMRAPGAPLTMGMTVTAAGSKLQPVSSSAAAAALAALNPALASIKSISCPLPKSVVPAPRLGMPGLPSQAPSPASAATSATSLSGMAALQQKELLLQQAQLQPPGHHPGGAKERKSLPAGASYSSTGDEDINDVAAMGGVNLAEESQRMQGATDMLIGAQIRSCKDETFLQSGQLHHRIARLCRERGLDEPGVDVIQLVSHATQERLKTLIEKLNLISEHRLDIVKVEGDYEVTQDVKGQMRFLSELDRLERRRHEEAERELLLRAAKSRTKTEDPEKEKLKAKAKELQRIEEEQLRHDKANNTALLAIGGPRKKMRLDEAQLVSGGANYSFPSFSGRPRTKRVHLRDLMFLMEQEKDLKRSHLLWKAYTN